MVFTEDEIPKCDSNTVREETESIRKRNHADSEVYPMLHTVHCQLLGHSVHN